MHSHLKEHILKLIDNGSRNAIYMTHIDIEQLTSNMTSTKLNYSIQSFKYYCNKYSIDFLVQIKIFDQYRIQKYENTFNKEYWTITAPQIFSINKISQYYDNVCIMVECDMIVTKNMPNIFQIHQKKKSDITVHRILKTSEEFRKYFFDTNCQSQMNVQWQMNFNYRRLAYQVAPLALGVQKNEIYIPSTLCVIKTSCIEKILNFQLFVKNCIQFTTPDLFISYLIKKYYLSGLLVVKELQIGQYKSLFCIVNYTANQLINLSKDININLIHFMTARSYKHQEIRKKRMKMIYGKLYD